MVASQALPVGHYSQLRLELGNRNNLTLADGSNVALEIPSGMQSGLKLQLDLSTKLDAMQDVFIDFDVAESLHVQLNRHVSRYMLRPVLRSVVKQRTGTLFGTLTSAVDGQPLAESSCWRSNVVPMVSRWLSAACAATSKGAISSIFCPSGNTACSLGPSSKAPLRAECQRSDRANRAGRAGNL